jgi:hypothetical protein
MSRTISVSGRYTKRQKKCTMPCWMSKKLQKMLTRNTLETIPYRSGN